ncbi:MAG: hypothetical protein ACJA2S_003877 [Cyclobacteriaceae bacterium]|jgi:hypothetical protein
MNKLFTFIITLSVVACFPKEEIKIEGAFELPLFSIVSPSRSNILFKNMLKESSGMNGISYEYFYNGSGVAVGDFNNDGWEDIYLVSTLKKNHLYLNTKSLSFRDVTDISKADTGSGFDSGVTVVDINQDGLLDIYVCRTGRFKQEKPRRNALMVNQGITNGIPVFEEQASKYGLDNPSFSTQAGFFDYDRDGDLDMFLINHGIDNYPDDSIDEFLKSTSEYRGERLFRNDEGEFNDVTTQSGIINNMLGYDLGLGFGDLNNDGWPDVYVSNDFSGQDHMYINDQNGRFSEVIKKSTRHISNFSMGNDIADFNNDGWLDVISVDMMAEDNYGMKTSMSGMSPSRFFEHVASGLHHQYMYNTLQLNNGVGDDNIPIFSDVAQLGDLASTDWSWAPLFVDMDNDGDKDLFISNGIKRDFRNNDFVNYRKKKTEEFNNGPNSSRGQFELDLIKKMPTRKKENYFYLNQNDLTFKKLLLPDSMKFQTNSNGAAYADFDNDGDMDFVVNNSDDFSFIYENNSDKISTNNFLKVMFKGPKGNLSGIGNRVKIVQGDQIKIQEQYTTRGFQSSVSQVVHFGLGNDTIIDELEVIWFDGKRQRLKKITGNKLIIVDYKDASEVKRKAQKQSHLFEDITGSIGKSIQHRENDFNDFIREELLPHKQSTMGPSLAVGDLNRDGLDDFFIGGAKGYEGQIYLQEKSGVFRLSNEILLKKEKMYEDVGGTFFDADADGDLDIYVVSGGSEFELNSSHLQDRIYINDGFGEFGKAFGVLPAIGISGSVVKAADFDSDGDLDLFVGGRLTPGEYPKPTDSYILRNDGESGKLSFTDVSNEIAPMLRNIGMVTDAEWVDLNDDGMLDLLISGEWMAIRALVSQNGKYEDRTQSMGLDKYVGWWNCISTADFDKDGDLDFVAGNLGLNYKYKASAKEPFEVYLKDFDNNNTLDIVLGYYNQGQLYPLRGRECSSNQVPDIKKKFTTYNAFASATLEEVYGVEQVENALHYKATTFASSYFQNNGNGTFSVTPLDNLAQISSINDIIISDFDGDSNMDMLMAGNLYGSEIETPRNDASYGTCLLGDGKGHFKSMLSYKSGLTVMGEVKNIDSIVLANEKTGYVFDKNDGELQIVTVKNNAP